MNKQDVKNLKKRYLIWLYLITKEAFDRYERKFTQFDIDEFILEGMEKELKEAYLPQEKKALEKYVNDYRQYINEKEQACLKLKYKDKKINPYFLFLDVKLEAIEKAIVKEFDKKTLEEIKSMYEQEMTEKILKKVKHK
ncbi:MAG: hypothetical protein ABIH18_06505 [Candidatus Omnitrophota bacterium]